MNDPPMTSSGLLEIDELAYLLATVSAERVVGFDPSVFVEANIERGLQLLKDHDSVVARDGGWSLNPELYLLAATIGAPERAMTVTLHNIGHDNGEVGIAYFESRGTTIEIKPTDDRIEFTMANHNSLVSLRANQVAGQLDAEQSNLATLQVASEGFATAMKAPDRQASLEELFSESLPEAERTQVAAALVSDVKVATVEGVGFLGRTPVLRKDLYCIGNPALLVAGEQRAGTSIYISGFSIQRFVEYVDLIWDVVDVEPPTAEFDSESVALESS